MDEHGISEIRYFWLNLGMFTTFSIPISEGHILKLRISWRIS